MKEPPYDQVIALKTLERIAKALDCPVISFLSAAPDSRREAETVALVRAFDSITDLQARARCLAFIATEAERARKA